MNIENRTEADNSGDERRERLLREACALPLCPGVYIMRNARGKVIYVGKSRKLRDRVSQYFRNGEKNLKTERMTAAVDSFEYIVCDTEIEALTLENTLIKQYSPRYNIKLKDAKSYPYIKITSGAYPRLAMSRKREDDGARYFGPYSGTSTVFSVISLVNKTFGLPSCKKRFPADIGKDRPCLYYRIGQCRGVCTGNVSEEEYRDVIDCAADVLRGNTAAARRELEERMYKYADEESFEAAARCRDTIKALEALSQKQKVVASPDCEQDVCGVYSDATGAVLSLLSVRGGSLVDKIDFPISGEAIADSHAFCSLLCEHYKLCDSAPGRLLLGFECDDDDISLLSEYLSGIAGKRVQVTVPMRGDNRKLCNMASENAREAAARLSRDTERTENAAVRLACLLGLETVPERIEAYDISNYGDEHITAGMIVSDCGHFRKRDYRSFNIKTTEGADDYGAMREALILPTRSTELAVSTKNLMSVIVPTFALTEVGEGAHDMPYGVAFTSGELDAAVRELSAMADDLVKLAELEKSAQMLAQEIERTRRRVNALEYVMIPQFTETIRSIQMKLEENERQNTTRLMKTKEMLAATR